MRFNYMICPAQDLSTNVFSAIKCQPNNVFVWRSLALPASISGPLSTLVCLFPFPLLLTQLTLLPADRQASHRPPLGSFPTPLPRSRDLRELGCAVRRVLRKRVQEGV
jgi:hypothetical protein